MLSTNSRLALPLLPLGSSKPEMIAKPHTISVHCEPMRGTWLKSIFFCLLFASSLLASTDNIQIDADEFELDAKRNNVTAKGNVVVQQRDVTLFGKKATYNQDKLSINLIDEIKVVKGDMLMFCDRVHADGKKNTIAAKGNVTFTFKEMRGEARSAFYDMNAQKLTLKGRPTAWQGKDQIKGDIIYVDLAKSKVTTKGKAQILLSPERF